MARKSLLKDFVKPEAEYEILEDNQFKGKFSIYPLERGFGTTLGNSLRRTLLSSIQGFAIAAIKVMFKKDGKTHYLSSQYDQIYGIKEDTHDIISSLKKLDISFEREENITFSLSFENQSQEIKASEFEKISGIKVYNKDLHIFTLMKDASIDIEFDLKFGRGYVPEDVNKKYIDDLNVIAIDSIYSPIKRANFTVEPARLGNKIDYDKLILEIETNGIIKPSDAIAEASKLLKDSYDVFINFDETTLQSDSGKDKEDELIENILKTPIEDMELSVRASNCLKAINVKTLEDLIRRTEDEIIKTKNFGKKSLVEIKEKLKSWNLSLGIKDFSALKNTIKFSKIDFQKKTTN